MSENQYLTLEYAAMTESKSYLSLVRELVFQRYEDPPLACVHSYGCQQSVADGEKLKGLLAEMGYGFTDLPDEADFVLYNTCAVRETAEQRVFGNIGELKHCKQRRPNMIIGVSGCMTEQQQVADTLKKSYPHVDIVVGTNAFTQLPRLVYEKLAHNRRSIKPHHTLPETAVVEGIPTRRDGKVKAWVPVMYGCDNFCSYCIVPYVRGRERSRESTAILDEISALIADGCRDITLLGQNVNSYGKGLPEQINFATLLRRINALEGDFRLRFMTSHPKDCTHELIDAMADCEKVARHLHLPVQSGSNEILKAMNRHYTTEQYLELIDYARQKMPDISLTSDIIVGFPGERYEDFAQTLALVQQVEYTLLYTFLYSMRSGTKAEHLPDPVPQAEKSRWFQELLAVQAKIGQTIMQGYVGSTQRVLAEGPGHGEGLITARSDGNIIVEFPADASCVGSFVNVRIQHARNWALTGEQY